MTARKGPLLTGRSLAIVTERRYIAATRKQLEAAEKFLNEAASKSGLRTDIDQVEVMGLVAFYHDLKVKILEVRKRLEERAVEANKPV